MGKLTLKSELNINSRSSSHKILNILISSFRSGLFGYIIFFVILSFTKLIGTQLLRKEQFIIESEDAYLCILGFLFAFLIKLIKNISSENNFN